MRSLFSLAAAIALAAAPAAAQTPATPCCGIIAIDAAKGVVTAKVTANGNVFQFKVADARTLATLKVGQGVYANFGRKQVSLDGRAACCAITSGPSAPAQARPSPPAAGAPAPAPAPAAAPPPPPPTARAAPASPSPSAAAGIANAAPISAAFVNQLPIVTFGPPVPRTTVRTRATSRFQTATVTTQVAGRSVAAPVLYLRGLKAVGEAPDLPPGAKRLLQMLVRRTPRDQSDHYIVNTQMAREWIAAHPVPDDVKPTEPKEKKCGNWYDSWDCAGEAASDEWQRTFDHAQNEWGNAEKTLADAWQTSVECFTERTISSGDIPVKFSLPASMTVNLSQSGSKGSGTGTVAGSVTLGIPMQSDAAARIELFYIPCLPFAVRPKALSANGVLTVGQELTTRVSATGSFNKTFTIPPTGGPVIPIQVFPIVVGGVPVAELDVSAYIEGEIEVSANGRAEGQFQIKNSNPTGFDFTCSGKGCNGGPGSRGGQPAATTTNQSAQIQGTVSVKPAVYTALQLDFNYEALSARIGPQPYLLGVAAGGACASGSQQAGGPSSGQENHILSADLDWGVELRAEALVLGKIVGNSYRKQMMDDRHLWFRDLAPGGSNALVASVRRVGPALAGKRTEHRVRMPTCYPYTNRVTYEVTWTGGAMPVPLPPGKSSACSWSASQSAGTCQFNPAEEFMIGLVWPTPGSWSLSVVPVKDAHDRVFMPGPPPTRLDVNVEP